MDAGIHHTRTVWSMLAVNWAINVGICYLIVRLFKDTYDWTDVMWVFFGIVAIEFAVWLKNKIVSSVIFRLIGKNYIRQIYFNQLSSHNMPKPDRFNLDPDNYFLEIIADENAARDHTIIASAAIGVMDYAREAGRVIEFLRLNSGIQQALSEYSET